MHSCAVVSSPRSQQIEAPWFAHVCSSETPGKRSSQSDVDVTPAPHPEIHPAHSCSAKQAAVFPSHVVVAEDAELLLSLLDDALASCSKVVPRNDPVDTRKAKRVLAAGMVFACRR